MRGPRLLLLAGLAVLIIDVGLSIWGMHRDSQWNATVSRALQIWVLPFPTCRPCLRTGGSGW